ncbi:MAG: nucleotide exchange factor GrpE [Gemmatimonadota bacterium]
MIENSGFGGREPADDDIDDGLGEVPFGAGSAEATEGRDGIPPIELTEATLQKLSSELEQSKDRHLRLAAEYDNFRKRTARERADLIDKAQGSLAGRLLEALDDLDRMVGADHSNDPVVVQQGLVLIDRKLRKELEAAGLERVDPVGQPFDPAVAEAVHVLPSPDPVRDHTVAATFQAGYRFKGTLIRPARVQVYSSEGHA